MKSLFSMSPFSQANFAPAFAPDAASPMRSELGQAADDITGLSTGIEDILKQLPPSIMGTYQKQYQDCQTKLAAGGVIGLVAGGKCLYDLYQTLKNLLKANPGAGPLVPLPIPATAFPVLPAAITAVGGIILVYALTKL